MRDGTYREGLFAISCTVACHLLKATSPLFGVVSSTDRGPVWQPCESNRREVMTRSYGRRIATLSSGA